MIKLTFIDVAPRDPYAIEDDDMVVVDMEDADGQSPKEGSRGSKRKSKREVNCMQVNIVGTSQLQLTHFVLSHLVSCKT